MISSNARSEYNYSLMRQDPGQITAVADTCKCHQRVERMWVV